MPDGSANLTQKIAKADGERCCGGSEAIKCMQVLCRFYVLRVPIADRMDEVLQVKSNGYRSSVSKNPVNPSFRNPIEQTVVGTGFRNPIENSSP
jgi:hypothetical protein